MEKKAKFNIPGWHWMIAMAVFFVAVLTLQQYILLEMEQERVLVYEGGRIIEQMMRAGGIADFIALFLQQFFLSKVAGAAIMALLLTFAAIVHHKIYSLSIGRKTTLAEKMLCCLPSALLFLYTEGKIYFITGHIAVILSSLSLLLGALLLCRKSIIACALIPLLVIFTGFAASTAVWPMVVALTLFALIHRKNYIAAGATVASAVVMVALARYTCLALTDTELFSPDIFSYRLQASTVMPWIWAAMIAIVVIPFIVKKYVSEKVMNHVATFCIVAVAVVGMTCKMYKSEHDENAYERLALQNWMDTGDYARAADYCSDLLNKALTANTYYMIRSLNYELENEVGGVLSDPHQLIMAPNSALASRRYLMTLYYYLGYVNGAQREAFEYNEVMEGMMVPSALKLLAQTNIIQGNYAAAEKYLNYLEHTLFYSDWAKEQRVFLYNDKAVEKSPELSARRKAMKIESIPQTWTTIPMVVRQIALVAPELPATNYMKAFLRLGVYNKTQYEAPQHNYIQY